MSWWRVDTDTLAGSRFATSPLAEALAALKTLHRGHAAHLGERQWLDTHLASYRARLADDPTTTALVEAALRRRWNATFLTPTPLGGSDPAFAEELEQIRSVPPATVVADLAESLSGSLPALLRRDDLAQRAADLLEWVWAETIQPSWPRRRRIIEADIVARTARAALHGWATALNEMRPGMRWLGDDRLQTTVCDSPPLELSRVQLMFVPVTLNQTWVCWDVPAAGGRNAYPIRRYAVVYPCSGVLADDERRAAPKALAALLGPARAELLTLLDAPKTTTQLVALTGLPLGSVGRHLRILREANLTQRRRAGRSVLYFRTGAAQVLMAAQFSGVGGL
ncbi:helix-turn-helix domain-containing protein [Streptomyces sp. TG1A-8]|uniref:ArsR family transcriptional regulator n=1 Tax=Streptomyces sp. TG1A-8 TaxID=3051385 RepID=UPI00265C3CC9|nr:ArsR family transcriptional regulator [Streptomyces sp. TG1A-8]MDO0930080.1 helix-turn-helix domain-containing protein [Streptomyces sp. TG1A-8]